MTAFFEGFELRVVETRAGPIRLRIGGRGPTLLLLHGHPRTHTTWWRVAPLLAERFTVLCPDLPGFGSSYQPETLEQSSGRAKAAALEECMRNLGFDAFAVAGHDRGSYRAFRLAMDFPEKVTKLAVLDGVPIYEALDRADWQFAKSWWHWFFFAQSEKAEAAVTGNPDLWYPCDPLKMGAENASDFLRATRDPAVVRGMLADYKAGLEYDYFHDCADLQASRRLACPLGVFWSVHDDMERLYGDPTRLWRAWTASGIDAFPINSGHHMAEDAPVELAEKLLQFFSSP
ncbi:MAG TPA: alpha/beta hydrolase [Mesorhizobium sp.]|jgi:haloacetate dehalogenase|uniref:alpha/beta hydrolase n=1 Tax=Mesorhizobium sp. TaxID=1871066 RepID=UPI002DDCE7A3|nr:alpha/beta hydrolase [Mesorhizobium sp.]HEV2503642.1 alpha/beta hydrolase [Mesorhizobium sp.]